jgi:hypothetical protein
MTSMCLSGSTLLTLPGNSRSSSSSSWAIGLALPVVVSFFSVVVLVADLSVAVLFPDLSVVALAPVPPSVRWL